MLESSLLLIVCQRPQPVPGLAQLAEALRSGFGLDPYTLRQQLLGIGMAQLARGTREDLEALGALVRRYGYDCRIVPQPAPVCEPLPLRGLRIAADAVEFACAGERTLRLERSMRVVGILADVSGRLGARQATRLLNRNAYRGSAAVALFNPAEIRRAVLTAEPVFDCYLLDADGRVGGGFRARPGRFDPSGLGQRGGLSAFGNLEALVDLPGEFTSAYTLRCDFGLSPLPGCRPQPVDEDPGQLQGNLAALTRYGGLIASLVAMKTGAGSAEDGVSQGPDAVLAEMTGQDEQRGAPGSQDEAQDAPLSADLPPPPEASGQDFSLRRAWPLLMISATGALLALADHHGALRPLLDRAWHSGLLAGAFALTVCRGGFACLRLKRLIEDTPTSRIRSLAMGPVEVHGRARRRYALVAPQTGTPCVWYRLTTYRRESGNRWRETGSRDSSHVPFVIEDGSGRALVSPAGATVRGGIRHSGYGDAGAGGAAAEDGGPEEKWVEQLLVEGSGLYVFGYVRPSGDADPGLRRRMIAALRQLKLDPVALRHYDANGDGRLDEHEWQVARDQAARQAAADQLREGGAAAGPLAMLGRPPRGLPFLIAEAPGDAPLARYYGWSAVLLLGLGLAAAGAALWLASSYFSGGAL